MRVNAHQGTGGRHHAEAGTFPTTRDESYHRMQHERERQGQDRAQQQGQRDFLSNGRPGQPVAAEGQEPCADERSGEGVGRGDREAHARRHKHPGNRADQDRARQRRWYGDAGLEQTGTKRIQHRAGQDTGRRCADGGPDRPPDDGGAIVGNAAADERRDSLGDVVGAVGVRQA